MATDHSTPALRQRRADLRDYKRREILRAARAVIQETGGEGFTIRSVAAAAGYTPGAVYGYFEGKAALARALLAEELGSLTRDLHRLVTPARRVSDTPPSLTLRRASHRLRRELTENALFPPLAMTQVSARDARADEADGADRADRAMPGGEESGGGGHSGLDRALSSRIIALLGLLETPLAAVGASGARAHGDTLRLAALVAGLALFERSGLLAVTGHAAQELLEEHLDRLTGGGGETDREGWKSP